MFWGQFFGFGARFLRAQIGSILGMYYEVFRVIFEGWISVDLGAIFGARECRLGFFDVVVLRGQIWGWFAVDLGAHLGMFAGCIQECQDVPFENFHWKNLKPIGIENGYDPLVM